MAAIEAEAPGASASTCPRRAGLVLVSLIVVAAVANLNLAVANAGPTVDPGPVTVAGFLRIVTVPVGASSTLPTGPTDALVTLAVAP